MSGRGKVIVAKRLYIIIDVKGSKVERKKKTAAGEIVALEDLFECLSNTRFHCGTQYLC
jgi:hypothetical protein